MALSPIGDLGIALKADVDDYQKSMATASDLTSGLSGAIRGLSATARNLGVAMTGASAIAGAAMFTLSQRAERVNAAFREVDTLVQGAANSQEKYGQLTSDLNTEMGLQADRLEVIEGLYQSISAGIGQSTEAQREFLTTASKLAVVGRVELGTSVDVLSTVMNTYGLQADQAQDVSESLFQTVQFGKTRMEDLAPVLGRVAALGSNLSVQIDEIGAAMGVLTRTGFGARVAATGLRNIFRAMMRPSETMREQLRGIALEQDLFAESMGESEEQVREIAQRYRDAKDALSTYTSEMQQARDVQEKSSLAIQEARLKIEAIEEGRLDQLPELTTKTVEEAETIQELNKIIDNQQFQVNKARVEEEKYRQEKEKQQETLSGIREEFKNNIDVQGDLEGGIGNLVLQNQDFVDTLVQLRERTKEQNVAFNELFPRTRALQGALALVGDDGEALTNIFEQMEEGTFDAAESWDNLDESAKENFDSFEEFQSVTEDVTSGDLNEWFEQAQGPQQRLRDSISELQEALSSIGRVFTEDLTESISTFTENFNNLVERFSNLEENVRENISEFMVLATTIGLVLGPLLLFGGQIALIAQAMGSMFIPFALLSGTAIGILAGAFSTAASGGEEAQSMFEEMRSFLAGLVDTVNWLRRVFVEETLPGMITAGEGVVDVFSAIFGELSDGSSEGGSLIRQFASLWGDAFALIGKFLSSNADRIANFVGTIADGLINVVVPAIILLGQKFIDDVLPKIISLINDVIPVVQSLGQAFFNDVLPSVINIAQDLVSFFRSNVIPAVEEAWNTFNTDVLPWLQNFITSDVIPSFASLKQGIMDVTSNFIQLAKEIPIEEIISFLQDGATKLLVAITQLIDSFGKFLSENNQLITFLIVAVGAFISLNKAIGPLIAGFLTLQSALLVLGNALANGFVTLVLFAGKVIVLGKSVLTLKSIILGLKSAIALLGGPITIIIALIALLAAAWITDFGGMRDTLQPVVDAIQTFASVIVNRILPAIMNLSGSTMRFIRSLMGLIATVGSVVAGFLKLGGQSVFVEMAFAALSLMVKGIIEVTVGFIQILSGLLDALSAVTLLLQGDFSGAWKAAKDAARNAMKGVVNIMRGALMGIMGLLFSTVGTIGGLVMDIVLAILSPFVWLYNKLIGNSIIPEMIQEIVDEFISLPGRILSGIIEGFNKVISAFLSLGDIIVDKLSDTLDLFEKAKGWAGSVIDGFVKGLKNGVKKVGKAAGNVANGIKSKLGFGSPPPDYGQEMDPEVWGSNTTESFVEGMEENNPSKKIEDLVPKNPQSEFEVTSSSDLSKEDFTEGQKVLGDDGIPKEDSEFIGSESSEVGLDDKTMKGIGGSEMGGDTKIIVDEQAVYFAKGAFQGVSDEELPKKVRDTVDRSMADIVDELDGAGKIKTN